MDQQHQREGLNLGQDNIMTARETEANTRICNQPTNKQTNHLIHCHDDDTQHLRTERLKGSEDQREKYVECQQGRNCPGYFDILFTK